uniref:Uncharacterized protein n=1 Tax=Ganoderma sp. TQC-2021a TaxID=2816325 RepID=A0A8A5RCQ5_9APHY|nr:hypothetical protein [Ganoderma sp. TQC-2021a]
MSLKLVIPTLMTLGIKVPIVLMRNLKLVIMTLMTILEVRIMKELKTVKLFCFFPYKSSFQQQHSFFILSLLGYLGKDIPQEIEPLFKFTSSILLLTIAAFVGFIRIVLYILSVYYIEKYNLYEKYPKYQKWFRHFEKFRAYSIVYEIIFSIFIFIMIISLCVFMIWILLQ